MSTAHQVEYFSQEHVHTPDDGRGLRRVCVDGVEHDLVTYADTALGIAIVAIQPLRVVPGTDRVDEYVAMGDVSVERMVVA
jgi:hypothetical protein